MTYLFNPNDYNELVDATSAGKRERPAKNLVARRYSRRDRRANRAI